MCFPFDRPRLPRRSFAEGRNGMGVRPPYLLSFSDTKCVKEKRAMAIDGNIGNSHRPRSFQFVIGRLCKSWLGSRALLETHTVLQGWSHRWVLGCATPRPGCLWPPGQVHATYRNPHMYSLFDLNILYTRTVCLFLISAFLICCVYYLVLGLRKAKSR